MGRSGEPTAECWPLASEVDARASDDDASTAADAMSAVDSASAVEVAMAGGPADDAVAAGAGKPGASADMDDAVVDEVAAAPTDEVSEALSAFWAASDAVERSNAAALGDSEDDAPADTWFDPSLGDSLDDLVEADDLEEPGGTGRSNAGPRAAE